MAENRKGPARRSYKKTVFEDPTCYLCGRPIDMQLPAGLPGSPEMEDIMPVSKGGNPNDIGNLRPSHRSCNQRKGTKPVDVAIRNERARRGTSRIW